MKEADHARFDTTASKWQGFGGVRRRACNPTGISGGDGPPAPASAQENAKWFVLRDDKTNDCWTERLIEINGDYRYAFAQKASKPLDSEAKAMKREKELEQRGTCNKT